MPDGGLLKIEMEPVLIDSEHDLKQILSLQDRYVLITVSDTGMGMDDMTKEKLFEPFFTTKEIGKGTGLGLSIVYGIIEQYKGHIDVYSERGEGTVFRIYLPLIEKMKEEEQTE